LAAPATTCSSTSPGADVGDGWPGSLDRCENAIAVKLNCEIIF
jgi:hypothetical protein